MKKILLASVAITAFCAAPALAADMPVKAPATPAAFDWSGFYVGGDAGWQGSRIGLSSPFDPAATLTFHPHHDSFALGAHIGAQRQFGQLVLGVEGAYLAGFGRASLGATPAPTIFETGGTGTGQAKLKNIWSIGGRIGSAMGNWMPYLTGGYASGSFEFDSQGTAPAIPAFENAK